MWLILGVGAILAAVLNLVRAFAGKDARWAGFVSLSLTALTVCAFYGDGARRVLGADWGGLMDIMPTVSKALWVCVAVSILVNAIPLLKLSKKP